MRKDTAISRSPDYAAGLYKHTEIAARNMECESFQFAETRLVRRERANPVCGAVSHDGVAL